MKSMLQMIERATDPAELRQLLIQEELAADDILNFDEKDLETLYNKGFRTRDALRRADLAMLVAPPPLPRFLAQVILEKFNPAALTAGPGGWPRAAQAGCAGAV